LGGNRYVFARVVILSFTSVICVPSQQGPGKQVRQPHNIRHSSSTTWHASYQPIWAGRRSNAPWGRHPSQVTSPSSCDAANQTRPDFQGDEQHMVSCLDLPVRQAPPAARRTTFAGLSPPPRQPKLTPFTGTFPQARKPIELNESGAFMIASRMRWPIRFFGVA
jgi:hypothetical protein